MERKESDRGLSLHSFLFKKGEKMRSKTEIMRDIMTTKIQNAVRAICAIAGIPMVRIKRTKDSNVIGRTNGDVIEYNAEADAFSSVKNIGEKLGLVMGVVFHELGHVLYTDCAVTNVTIHALLDKRINDKELMAEPWYRDHWDKTPWQSGMAMIIANICEDGYIEEALSVQFPKSPLLKCMKYLRNFMFLKGKPLKNLQEYVDSVDKDWTKNATLEALLGIVHQYATSCRVRVDDPLEYGLPIYQIA